MDFHDLGKHCSAEGCNQQDFLPFTCNGCGNAYCLQHRTHAAHDCPNANFNDERVPECSLCGKMLKSPSGVPRDVILRLHVASGCVAGVRQVRSIKQKCSLPRCRGWEFVKISCRSCRKNFCLRHRHEDDHNCEGAGYKKAEYKKVGYKKAGYKKAGYKEAGYKEAGYKEAGYKEAGYKEAGYKEAGYNEVGYKEAECEGAEYEGADCEGAVGGIMSWAFFSFFLSFLRTVGVFFGLPRERIY